MNGHMHFFELCLVPPGACGIRPNGRNPGTNGELSDSRIRRLFGLREDHDGAVVTAGGSIQLRLNSNKCTKSDTEFTRRGK